MCNSYSLCDVNGSSYVGGLLGSNYSSGIIMCYSAGEVNGDQFVGGLIGDKEHGSVYSCFWDTQNSTQAISDGGTGKTTSEMQNINIFLNAGWDFVNEPMNGTANWWTISAGEYPKLSYFDSFPALKGSGTKESPYRIYDVNDLSAVNRDITASYKLMNDIYMNDVTWPIAIIPVFCGEFDGCNFAIHNTEICALTPYTGLFGYLDNGGLIQNLGIENISISAYEGGGGIASLAGCNRGTIINCYSTGNVSGKSNAGGLVSYNPGGLVENCYSNVTVNANQFNAGGIVGSNTGIIKYCYNAGAITGDFQVGGLAGYNRDGVLIHSYNTGIVNGNSDYGGILGKDYRNTGRAIDSCYFLDTTGPNNGYGVPLTETAMKQQVSFVGWDFVGESFNGENEIWRMCVGGVDYPRLSWEFAQNGDFACGDGVDFADLQALTEQWLTSVNTTPTTFNYACDANGDEQINLRDFTMLSENWP